MPRTIEVGVAIIVVDGGIFVFLIVACSLGGKKFNESVRQNDFLDSVMFIVYSQRVGAPPGRQAKPATGVTSLALTGRRFATLIPPNNTFAITRNKVDEEG